MPTKKPNTSSEKKTQIASANTAQKLPPWGAQVAGVRRKSCVPSARQVCLPTSSLPPRRHISITIITYARVVHSFASAKIQSCLGLCYSAPADAICCHLFAFSPGPSLRLRLRPLILPRPHVAYGAYPKVIKATFFSLDWTQTRDTSKGGGGRCARGDTGDRNTHTQ